MTNNVNVSVRSRIKTDDEDRWIDIHDDALMVSLGMRQPVYEGRDESVWTKTPEEKVQLAKMKARCTTILPKGWLYQDFRSPLRAKLIVRVRPSNKYQVIDRKVGHRHKKTTFSHKNVRITDIPRILSNYYVWKKDQGRQSLVISYNWNGKEYSPHEVPNVRWK